MFITFWKFLFDCSFFMSLFASKLNNVFAWSTSYKFLYHWIIFEVFIRVLVSKWNLIKSCQTSSSEHDVWWNLENFIIEIWNLIDDEIEDFKIFRLFRTDSWSAIAPGLIIWCLIVGKISDQKITIWL